MKNCDPPNYNLAAGEYMDIDRDGEPVIRRREPTDTPQLTREEQQASLTRARVAVARSVLLEQLGIYE